MKQMTIEQHLKFATSLASRNSEFLSGFVLVGFHAQTGEPVLVRDNLNDYKTSLALTQLTIAAANGAGICMAHQSTPTQTPPGSDDGPEPVSPDPNAS